MAEPLTVRSYAKINWTLDILSRREDGYHEIRTIYQTVSLHDRLHLRSTQNNAIEIVSSNPQVPCDETNLVYRAVDEVRRITGSKGGLSIEIEKKIPVSAGLGGGSSNAGATLLALNRLWRLGLEYSELVKIAVKIGSDVPFFLLGGTALGVGRGEEVYPLQDAPRVELLLTNPGFPVSTAEAYGGARRLTTEDGVRMIPFSLLAARDIHELPLLGRNDLEQVVLKTHPEIEEIKLRLQHLGAISSMMSGSGGTVYGVFDNQGTKERAASELRGAGLWCESVHTIGRMEYNDTLYE